MSRKSKLNIGDKIWKLTYLEDLGMREYGNYRKRFGLFECECGNVIEVLLDSVVTENTKSCGCKLRDIGIEKGQRFGRLVFVEDMGFKKYNGVINKKRYGLFQCDCGNQIKTLYEYVRKGCTVSCGCYNKQRRLETLTKHGLADHVLYDTLRGMISRCYNPHVREYKNYGERGIKVCNEWREDFMSFYAWAIKNGWQQGLQIDRINNDGDYEPNNCQWVTSAENNAIGKKRTPVSNKSGFNGVSFDKQTKKWRATISINKKYVSIGYFSDICDAIEARINKEIELLGEQKTNFHYDKNNFKKD